MSARLSLPDNERVQVLAPSGGASLEDFLAQAHPNARPFSSDRLEALASFSGLLLKNRSFSRDPACTAAAFWMRKANLLRFQEAHLARVNRQPHVLWVPVGKVFHVAPSNVDTLFLYSWTLAFLCGNANIVRLSKQMPPTVAGLLEVLDQAAGLHPVLKDQNRFVTYEHDAAASTRLSQWCTHRIVWGGDDTVAALRQIPLNPHASERSFASKFSFALFNASKYLAASEETRSRLASGFFNDLFWFDQAACSSPQVLFWVGSHQEGAEASARFLDALQAEAERRGHGVDASKACHRLNQAFDLAIQAGSRVDLSHPALVSVELEHLKDLDKAICGGGFLRIHVVASPLDVLPFVDQGDQTVTHFGFDESELSTLGRAFGSAGVDRLVPVGEALDFDPTWDGFDMVEDCLRRVVIRLDSGC